MNRIQQFAAELLQLEGGLVEPLEPEGLEVMLPLPLQQALGLPEWSRLGFGAELPKGARRVTLESEWMERLASLLGERGSFLRRVLSLDNPFPGSPERVLHHGLDLLNAVYRLQALSPAWTRYLILVFHYTAVSDEKRDGFLNLGFNLATGATLDGMLEALFVGVTDPTVPLEGEGPGEAVLPPLWGSKRLDEVLARTLPGRIHHHLEPFLHSMERRQERDLTRLHAYHNDLLREAYERLAALPNPKLWTDKHQATAERERRRIEAIAREYQAKVGDLRQKYALKVELEWIQTLKLIMPVQRFQVLIKRRKRERILTLDWNPLARKIEQAPCEYSYTWERPRVVCDEALHLVSPKAHSPCPQCGKDYCQACHPNSCPKCRHRPSGVIRLE